MSSHPVVYTARDAEVVPTPDLRARAGAEKGPNSFPVLSSTLCMCVYVTMSGDISGGNIYMSYSALQLGLEVEFGRTQQPPLKFIFYFSREKIKLLTMQYYQLSILKVQFTQITT